MPFKTRDIALDSWLLMVSAAFVLMGLAGMVQWLHYPLQTLLVPDTSLAAMLSGVGLLAVAQHCRRARLLAGGALLALMLYTLLHNAMAGGSQVGVSWLSQEPRTSTFVAILLVMVAASLLLGHEQTGCRRLWLMAGGLLVMVGLSVLGMTLVYSTEAPGLGR